MNCISCRSNISSAGEGSSVPVGGTEFRTIGNARSAVTKDRDGSIYLIYVCDSCLRKALDEGRAEKRK